MADYGLQTWDENGNTTLRITDRITRYLTEFDTGTGSGSWGDGRLGLGEPYITVRDTQELDAWSVPPTISYDRNGIYWSFPSGTGLPNRSVRIAYGVF